MYLLLKERILEITWENLKINYADEPYFSYEISKIFEHKSVMYMNSVVCHYKFGPQQDALEKSELLKRYEDLLP